VREWLSQHGCSLTLKLVFGSIRLRRASNPGRITRLSERQNTPEPGDVLQLRRDLDGMRPGWYTILLIHDASVQLCRSDDCPLSDDILPHCFCSTNIYNLCAFNRTGLRIPMESLRERTD
jgi:hypothetical protein